MSATASANADVGAAGKALMRGILGNMRR